MRTLLRTSGLALVLSVLAGTASLAQSLAEPLADEAISTQPRSFEGEPAPVLEPAADTPLPEAGSEAAPTPTPTPAPKPAVQVQTLSVPDIFSAGARNTGLTADLWKGSSADMAREILPLVGKKPLSPAAAALARRVLSTGADAPEGAGKDLSLAAARAEALLSLGDAAGVEAMLERTAGAAQDPALARLTAEASLILGHDDRACRVADGVSSGRDAPYWLRLRTFCLTLAGQTAEAQLTLDLAQQQNDDPDFARLIVPLMTAPPAAGAATSAGPSSLRNGLDMALSRALGLDVSASIASAPAAMVVTLARTESLPVALRVAAAGRAVRVGANVSAAYDLITVQPPQPAPVEGQIDPAPVAPIDVVALIKAPGAAGEARLLALARDTNDMAVRDQVAWGESMRWRCAAVFMAASRLSRPLIASLVQAKAPSLSPVLLATAAIAAGDPATGIALRATLPADMAGDEILILDALIAAATPPGTPGRTASVEGMIEAAAAPAPASARGRRQSAATLAAAMSPTLSPASRARLASYDLGKADAPPARLMALDLASEARLKGETVLAALAIANTAGAQGPVIADRVRIVRALLQAGMGEEASAFAVEGLVIQQGYASPPPPVKPAAAKPASAKPALRPKV